MIGKSIQTRSDSEEIQILSKKNSWICLLFPNLKRSYVICSIRYRNILCVSWNEPWQPWCVFNLTLFKYFRSVSKLGSTFNRHSFSYIIPMVSSHALVNKCLKLLPFRRRLSINNATLYPIRDTRSAESAQSNPKLQNEATAIHHRVSNLCSSYFCTVFCYLLVYLDLVHCSIAVRNRKIKRWYRINFFRWTNVP